MRSIRMRPGLTRGAIAAAFTLVFPAMIALAAQGTADLPQRDAVPVWQVPDIDTLPDDAWGRTVRRGHDLIARTASLIGPEVADPSRRIAGNNLNCQSCHLTAGTLPYALPLNAAFGDFPQYRGRSGKVDTIEDRINGCLMRSMNGRAMPPGDPDMVAMVAYLRFLAMGKPIGADMSGRGVPGRGVPRMAELDRAADPARGLAVFGGNCAACHGADGQGQRIGQPGDAQGYLFPPLWGPDSYNDGAGMARLITAANFVHANMPQGTTWEAPALSVEDAWDVAAYINSQPRPHMAGLEADYPVRREKPVDAPYGPWPDASTAEQHRLGPFAPIRAALRPPAGTSAPAAPVLSPKPAS